MKEKEIKTEEGFENVIDRCRVLFVKKHRDYGSSWRLLRLTSLTDQIFIKANRIRSIQTKGFSKIDEGIETELIGMINYSIIALIQLELTPDMNSELSEEEILSLYDKYVGRAKDLMIAKNHDYDEAWRSMRVSSIVDLILMKIKRIKQIEDNQGHTLVSEGVDAGYYDIINYSIFSMILITKK